MCKNFKRIMSYLLILAMVLTMSSVSSMGQMITKASFEGIKDGGTAIGNLVVSDRVELVIGDNTYHMDLYLNGVYETAVDLVAGQYEVKVTVNGIMASADSVTVSTDSRVYFRYANKELKNSINSKIVHTASFVGNFNGLEFVDDNGERYDISPWNPADDKGELTYVGGGIYTATFNFKKLDNEFELADSGYKVAFDDSWDYSIGNGGSNIPLTIPAGATKITIFVDEIKGMVYDNIRNGAFISKHNIGLVERNSFDTKVTLAGTMNDWSGNIGNGYDFRQISDTLYLYQISLDAGSYQYKVVFNGTDWFENGSNHTFHVTEDNTNVIIVYNTVEDKIYDSINDTSALSILLGMSKEPAQMKVIDNKNGTTTFIATGNQGQSVVLYYATKADVEIYGVSAFTWVTIGKIGNDSVTSETIFFGDTALDIVYYYEIDGTKVLDFSNDIVTIGENSYSNYKRAEFTGRIVNVPGTFPGPTWDPASNQMVYLGNGLYEYTFINVPAGNYEFKISFTTWAENYGVGGLQDGANYSVTVPSTQDVTIYYTDLKTHLAVTSLNYVFIDAFVEGSKVEKTKFTDHGLTGIYSATVYLEAGTYSDVVITSNDETLKKYYEFTLDKAKEVTFYYAPTFDIYYNNADDFTADINAIKYDTKDSNYKSIYGAVPTDTSVTFTIDTDKYVTAVKMLIKMNTTKIFELNKKEKLDGGISWSVTTQFNTIGEYEYFFIIYSGNAVKIYCDDSTSDYGTGVVTDLTSVNPYNLVVYINGFKTPDWMKNAVVYQIFPDRFANGDTSNDKAQLTSRGATDYEFITDWGIIPENPEQKQFLTKEEYERTGAYYGDGNWSNEIYGGDLEGIIKHIDYLKALGVTVIYLNPVFSSISSHRYDASDYSKIDPILGELGDFEQLVSIAEKNGMKIILDGVFNHVSDDSTYFDRYYKFLNAGDFDGKIGAYPYWAYVYDYMKETGCSIDTAENVAKKYFEENFNVTDFSYTTWFEVYSDSYLTDGNGNLVYDTVGNRTDKPVYGYEGWWGYDSMPVIKSTNGSEYQTADWAEKIIGKIDANGNVENKESITQYWLSKGSLGWRLDVANEVSDETWQNFRKVVKALNSDAVIIGEIWDDATEYLLGDMYDSVMNYVFRNAVLSFAKGGSSKESLVTLEKIRERYPKEAFYAMMNLVGSHDTTRLLSYLDGIDDDRAQKDIASAFPKYDKTGDEAKQRQYLVALMQFTYPGAPTIYYGDEVGMVGADDPDNRRTFPWGKGNKELVTYYATLANIRSQYSALRTGSFTPITTNSDNLMGYVRSDEKDTIVVIINNAKDDIRYTLDVTSLGLKGKTLTDILTSKSFQADDTIDVTVPPLSGLILTENIKIVSIDEVALKVAYEKVNEEPTPEPTTVPTSTPTVIPTATPIITPTVIPTTTPTIMPTTIPTVPPTVIPTSSPKDETDENPETKIDISNATVKLSKTEYTYDGKTKKPSVTVIVGKVKLIKERDYTVKYQSNKKVGIAKVIITGRGNYRGTIAVTFKIKPAKTKFISKSVTKNSAIIKWKKVSNVTGYQIEYSTSDKFISKSTTLKTIKGASKNNLTIKNLSKNKKYYIRIRTYKIVGGKKMYGEWTVTTIRTKNK